MTLPDTMLAVVARHRGGPGAMHLETLPCPRPGAGRVLLRVEAAAVNFSDVKRRRGDPYPFPTSFPFVPGGEVSGTVAAVGAGVDALKVGDPVFGLVGEDGSGGYAEFALAVADRVAVRPGPLDATTASTLTIAGSTAMLLLREAGRLVAGESVVVPAAAGGVGSFLVQVARHLHAGPIVALAGDPARRAQALERGADAALDPRAPDWPEQVRALTGGRGVDLLLESGGGDALARGLSVLAPFGRAVVYGAASGEDARLDATTLRALLYAPALDQSLSSFNLGGWFGLRPERAGAALRDLVGLVLRGDVRTPEVHRLALADAAEAHRRLECRESSGKLVLVP